MRKLIPTMMVGLFVLLATNLFAIEYGIASFYSDHFQNKLTASGELYDMNKYTAAHKSYPFGTIVRVTRLDNNRSVRVRINDRGPYTEGRIIDLSKMAAKKLGMVEDGSVKVRIDVIEKSNAKKDISETLIRPSDTNSSTTPDPAVFVRPTTTVITTTSPAPTKNELYKVDPPKKGKKDKIVTGGNYSTFDLYKIQLLRPKKEGYGVQVASLREYSNVFKQIAELQEKWFNNILVSVEQSESGNPIYKVILGPFPDVATAKSYKASLKKAKKINGFIVDLSSLKQQ